MQKLKSKITKLKKKESQWNLKVNWISQKKGELEDKTMGIIMYEEAWKKKERETEKSEENQRNQYTTTKKTNICIMGIPEEKRGINSKRLTPRQNSKSNCQKPKTYRT